MPRVRGSFKRAFRAAPFEVSVSAAAVVYAGLQLSPSSYALALQQLGDHVTPLLGAPRDIRTDEFAIWTPLFEAAVNNGFHVVNSTSFWHESLLSVVALPLLNWGIVFKPQLWSFFLLPPSLAYSIYWASLAALMLVGWSFLFREIGFRRKSAALLSMLIFFTPLVQVWWTTWGPQFAFLPWLVLAAIHIDGSVKVAAAVAFLTPVWLLSFFYVPGVFPQLFLALVLCLAFVPERFTLRRAVAVGIGGLIGAVIVYLYFRPVLAAYRDSLYPGHRRSNGGDLAKWQAASQFLPGTTTNGYKDLLPSNIAEDSTIATWLPLLAICLVDVRQVLGEYRTTPAVRRDVRRIAVLAIAVLVITLWQTTPVMPVVTYVLGFAFTPEQRALFATGVMLVTGAGYAVDRLPLLVTARRLTIFAALVIGSWLLASWQLRPGAPIEVRDELIVLLPVAALLPFALSWPAARDSEVWRIAVLVVALVPALAVWGLFNPIQSTRVMFHKPKTVVTRTIDALASKRPDGAVAVPGISGAILNGLGYRSVTHLTLTPSPELFRRYFPNLKPTTFNTLFNRYVWMALTNDAKPRLLGPFVVLLPISRMSHYAAVPR